jgi:hypothetical protein
MAVPYRSPSTRTGDAFAMRRVTDRWRLPCLIRRSPELIVMPEALRREVRVTMQPVTLPLGRWANLPLYVMAEMARARGYGGLGLARPGDRFDLHQALTNRGCCKARPARLVTHGTRCRVKSTHPKRHAICDDPIDLEHKGKLPTSIWQHGKAIGHRSATSPQSSRSSLTVKRSTADAAPLATAARFTTSGPATRNSRSINTRQAEASWPAESARHHAGKASRQSPAFCSG